MASFASQADLAEKKTSFCSPRRTLTLSCSGAKRHGMSLATFVSNSTQTTRSEVASGLESALCVVPPYPVIEQNRR